MSDNEIIANAIRFFEEGPYKDRKEYVHELYLGKGVEKDGFTFYLHTYCYVVFKPTDLNEEPQYKGESLRKVVPTPMEYDNIPKLLEAQYWVYD